MWRKIYVAGLLAWGCSGVFGQESAPTKPGDHATRLATAAVDAKMCGESRISADAMDVAYEIFVRYYDPTKLNSAWRVWRNNVQELYEIEIQLTGIDGRPTSRAHKELCDKLIKSARKSLHEADRFILQLR